MADGNSEADKLGRFIPIKGQAIDEKDLESQARRYENERYREDTESRKSLSLWARWVVSIYLNCVILILLFNFSYLHLSDAVLIALLGTTTLNVLGLMYIVLKGYFAAKR